MSASLHSDSVRVRVFGKTDVGRTREHNEDAFIVADLTTMDDSLGPQVQDHALGDRGTLFMVADGMGGAAAGEIASAIATEVVLGELNSKWCRSGITDPETFAVAIKAATESANDRIHAYAAEHPENRGMGTTATIAGVLGDTLYLAQVGDSRGYLIRDGIAHQITQDQSLMQKLIEAGELTAEEAEVSNRRNIILQALGPEPTVRVDLTHQQVSRGDVLVLCSDGLSGQMRAADIARIVTAQVPNLEAACTALIALANDNGGPDNITVIVALFDGEGLKVSGGGALVGHRVYTGEIDARPTVRVSTDVLPPETEEERRASGGAPAPPAPPARPAATHAPSDVATTPDTAGQTRPAPSAKPAPSVPPVPATRISVGMLRLILGGIAAALALWLLLRNRS
jgi:serine/threonine protein phosphatase PrpC